MAVAVRMRMAMVGVLLGSVGTDLVTGLPRFTLGFNPLVDGIGIVPVVVGLFGVAEVLASMEQQKKRGEK